MEYKTISDARLSVSGIGLGCVTFGREIAEPEAFALLDHARGVGVNFFDTAMGYGAGASETILGRWLRSRRPAAGEAVVATKMLPPFFPSRVEGLVDECLDRLGVPAVDLVYVHQWDDTADSPEFLDALDALVRAGKVRALGASNYELPQLERTVRFQRERRLARMSVLQNNQNLAVSGVSDALREFCRTEGIAVVTYSPLGAGFLTGKHSGGVEPGSRFDVAPGHQRIYFTPGAEQRLAHLKRIAARTGHEPAHLALAWALHRPDVAAVLVGGRKPAHLQQALEAQAFDDPEVFAELLLDGEPPLPMVY